MPPSETAPACRPPFVTLPRGPFRHGDFYRIWWGREELAAPDRNGAAADDLIVSAGPPRREDDRLASAATVAYDDEAVERCPLDPSHVLLERRTWLTFCFTGTGELPPVLGGAGMPPVLHRRHADRLLASDLTGVGVCPARVDEDGWTVSLSDAWIDGILARTNDERDFRHLFSLGRWPLFRGSIHPPEADRCPYCGRAPVRCPGCGESITPCPNCGQHAFAGLHSATPEELAAGVILIDPEQTFDVVDPRRWDGTDYMPPGIATRRFVDFLLSLHVWPFVAVPLPTLVEGLSEADLAKLDAARRPVTEGGGG